MNAHMTEPSAFQNVLLSITGSIATLTLNRPEVLNALSKPMLRELMLAMDAIETPASGARSLLLTGAGRAFCAGADLRSGQGGAASNGRHDSGYDLEYFYHPFLRRLRGLDIPLVTAINGPAVGVGASIALMGDIVVCARSAYFLHAFRQVALVPDGGASWLLPRLVGRVRAMELSLLGERLSAETALEWGMVNRVHDDGALVAEALAVALRLAQGPTRALGLTRRLYWESASNSHEEQLDLERRFQYLAGETQDFREGINAFLEKRPPRFEGR
jgi:2-(1,2-epoxy-1,2-dihydrophenyl)acetyl-CoA isomerase